MDTTRSADAARRLELLQRLGLLNADPDPAFDKLARIAAGATRSAMALVSFVGADRIWIRSHVGFDDTEAPIDSSFCACTIQAADHLEVEDARTDERFRCNAYVCGARAMRSYMGFPIRFEGIALGTIGVLDPQPRLLGACERAIFTDLAGMVESLLELRFKQWLLHEERRHAVELVEALRESEDMLAQAQRVARLGCWEIDAAPPCIRWSDELFTILGRAPADGPQDAASFVAQVHPDDRPLFVPAPGHEPRPDMPSEREFRFLRADGRLVWLHTASEPVFDGEGRVVRQRGTIQDISDRKESERLVREGAERYRRIVQTAEEGIWMIDAASVTTFVNPKMAAMLGYGIEEMVGRNLFDFMDAEATPTAHENVRRRRQGIAEQHDFRLRRKDGSPLWTAMSTSPAYDADGRYAGALAMVTDITERRAAEDALRESEARFRSLTALSSDWYWEQDAEYRLVKIVGGALPDDGAELPGILGRRPWEMPGMSSLGDADWTRHRATLDARRPFRDLEVSRQGRDGRLVVVSLSGEPIFDAEERFAGYRGVGRDITEQRRAHLVRLELEAQLRESQKMEAIGVLAGGIAHDFNNVLAGILGNVALALQDLPPGHPGVRSVEQIRKASLRGRGLVQQILAFARRQPREVVECELRPLVEEGVGLLRATLPAGVTLDVCLADEPLHVLADATQVEQVLMNLCTNAWHALVGGVGHIGIVLAPVALDADGARRVAPHLAPGRYARLTVRDDGRGMDAQTRARIFEPFFTTKPVGEGTGLGLSVAHGIVAAHGGAIGVETAPGRGSSFDIWLPRIDPAGGPERLAAPSVSHRGQGERVLYVDDDEVIVVMVERMLERLGYEPTCLADPLDAIERVRRDPDAFDVAVTDLNMPDLSGLDVARELARLAPDLPVVISSGNLPEDLQTEARRAGVRALLHKQYTLEELGAVIHWVLGGGQRLGLEPLAVDRS